MKDTYLSKFDFFLQFTDKLKGSFEEEQMMRALNSSLPYFAYFPIFVSQAKMYKRM